MPNIRLIFIICKHFFPKVSLHLNGAVGSLNVFLSPSDQSSFLCSLQAVFKQTL